MFLQDYQSSLCLEEKLLRNGKMNNMDNMTFKIFVAAVKISKIKK